MPLTRVFSDKLSSRGRTDLAVAFTETSASSQSPREYGQSSTASRISAGQATYGSGL